MENFYIAPTAKTPEVIFQTDGEFTITGNSYPEDVVEFYSKALTWLDEFLETNTKPLLIDINLKYINTSSTKIILNIINKVSTASKSTIKVRWIYEIDDEDMFATGEDIEKLTKLKFDFVRK